LSKLRGKTEELGWAFSCITGDAQLGNETFCYATGHFNDTRKAIEDTKIMTEVFIMMGFEVLRRKVEHIIYDERFSLGEWKPML
jgi:hypothetical protein